MYAARLVRAVRRLHEQPAAIRVLALLDELGPTTVSALARADRCSQPTMSLAVARLMESGEVTKTGDPADARRTVITLTARGRRTLAFGPARQRRQRGPAPGGARATRTPLAADTLPHESLPRAVAVLVAAALLAAAPQPTRRCARARS